MDNKTNEDHTPPDQDSQTFIEVYQAPMQNQKDGNIIQYRE